MSRKRIASHFARLAAILALFGALALVNSSWAISPADAADLLPVNGLLNDDGTLNLASAPHGTFDLRGWNVTLDAVRGPVLAPAGSGAHTPSAVGDWSALGSNGVGGGSLNYYVYALAVSGSDLYVGGSFTNVNNGGTTLTAADYIAKWDGTNWSALGSGSSGNGSLNSFVYALAVSGSDLYVGGSFTDVNNGGTTLSAADYVAKWDGTNWSALGSSGPNSGSLNSYVYALAVSGTNLYVGGDFSNVNNSGTTLTAADYIAKWDGTNWSALGSGSSGDGSLNYYVRALAVSGSNLYVGGNFTNVNNGGTVLGAADRVAKWDGTNWSALGSNGVGGGSLTNWVFALAVGGRDLYAGGHFINVNNGGTWLDAADYIAKYEISAVTATDLAAFTARVNAQQHVVVKWRTSNEMNLVGFNVYRATKKNGTYKRLNKALIAAKHPGEILGANYSRTNKKVNAGKTYFYKLEMVRANGASEWSAVRRVTLP